MTNNFRIDFDWLDFGHGNELDRAFSASIGIAVGDAYLTRIEDLVSKTVRNQVRGCAWQLGVWFAANWWRLRWEPEPQSSKRDVDWLMAHNMASVGGGFVWPSALFACDGESVEISLQASARGVSFEPIRYINTLSESIPANEFEQQVDLYIEGLLGRIDALQISDRRLSMLWAEVLQERNCDKTSEWRKLEAMAGYDPDSAPEEMMDLLIENQNHLGLSALEELTAAARHYTVDAVQQVQKLINNNQNSKPDGFRVNIPELKCDPTNNTPGQKPWERADILAAQAREQWALGNGPISNDVLMDLLQANESASFTETVVPAISPLAVRSKNDNTYDIYFNRKPLTTRRFAIGRLIGDHLCFTNSDLFRPATRSETARQKFQRAFSQSFLCPIESLLDYLNKDNPNEYDISKTAEYFDVSPLMVKMTLVNKGYLSRNALAWDD